MAATTRAQTRPLHTTYYEEEEEISYHKKDRSESDATPRVANKSSKDEVGCGSSSFLMNENNV